MTRKSGQRDSSKSFGLRHLSPQSGEGKRRRSVWRTRAQACTSFGMTESVNVVSHPLIQHKLSLMRERDRSIKSFRELLSEIGALLCYEVMRDLPLEMVDIETPL